MPCLIPKSISRTEKTRPKPSHLLPIPLRLLLNKRHTPAQHGFSSVPDTLVGCPGLLCADAGEAEQVAVVSAYGADCLSGVVAVGGAGGVMLDGLR